MIESDWETKRKKKRLLRLSRLQIADCFRQISFKGVPMVWANNKIKHHPKDNVQMNDKCEIRRRINSSVSRLHIVFTKWLRFCNFAFTEIIFVSIIVSTIGINPLDDFHMIGHKWRNIAFHNGSIPFDYVIIVHLRLIKLADNCASEWKKNIEIKSTKSAHFFTENTYACDLRHFLSGC